MFRCNSAPNGVLILDHFADHLMQGADAAYAIVKAPLPFMGQLGH